MSRVVSPAVESAITENDLFRASARLTVYKSRIFFEAADLTDNAPDFAHPVSEAGMYIPEAISCSGTVFTTVVVADDGSLFLMRSDSNVPIQPEISGTPVTADPTCRPGIFGNAVFYRAGGMYGGEWRRFTFDEALFIGGDVDCVIADDIFSDFTEAGAIYPTGDNDAFLCYILDGGIAVSLSVAGGERINCPSRYINPTVVYNDTLTTDLYLTHFAGAAETVNGRFFYFSAYDGSIRGVKYSNGMFSDIFTSIPADLSIARIGNVFSHNDVIHMAFRFERSEEFTSAAKYAMFSQSKDGLTFTLDMRILVTMADYRFMAAYDDSVAAVVFSATNRSYATLAHYQLVQEDAPSTDATLLSVSGSTGGFDAKLKSGAEEYFDDEYIMDGAFCKLEIGVQSTDGDELITQLDGSDALYRFYTYHDVVIADYTLSWADGDREHSLTLVPDGIWHTSVMTHPMYIEIQGKQGVYDPTNKLDNLYKFSGNAGVKWSLAIDMWTDDATPFSPNTHAAAHEADHWSRDLTAFLVDYPVFGDDAEYEIRLYGWSRAGVPDTNPNTADSTPTGTLNDDFYALIETEDADGNISTVVSLAAEVTSTYKHPIQTYFDAGVRAGSDPVIYSIANPGEGLKIKRLGIRVIAQGGNTTYALERVELPGIACQYTVENVADEQPFQTVEIQATWALVDTLTLQVTTGNAADGDQVEMNYTPVSGKVYAIAIVGDVEFTRSSIRYLQDPHFVAQIPTSASPYADPTWDRTYPPGTGPTVNASVEIEFDEWPYYDPARLTEIDVVGEDAPNANHLYLMHWADSRFVDSTISSDYIPYFYSAGNKHKIGLFLDGSGAISDIVRGEFTVYIFESPEAITAFDYYGGDRSLVGAGTFRIVSPTSATFAGQYTPDLDIQEIILTSDERTGSFWGISVGAYVKNNGASPAQYIVTEKMSGQLTNTSMSVSFRWDGVVGGYFEELSSVPYGSAYNYEYAKTVTIAAGATAHFYLGGGNFGSGETHREILIQAVGEEIPLSNQVPAPALFNFGVPLVTGTVVLGSGLNGHIETSKKGIPQIAFSTRPYSAFNFEVTGRFQLKGAYSRAGLIGLGADRDNFMLGYVRPGYAGIARVRGAVREDIFEEAVDEVEQNKLLDVRFWHRDGIFGVETKRSEGLWPQRGSQFLYTWDGADGALSTQDDIYHVGVYALIDPPKVRITGFRSSQNIVAVMPLDIDPDTDASGLSAFPTSGKLDIGGKIYTYTGKNTSVSVARGPFQLRSRGTWPSQYNHDRNGHYYPNYESIEILFFRWWTGAAHATDYANMVMASNEGYAWLNAKTLWKVWITTSGQVVWLRNRSRWYGASIPSYFSVDSEKIWITNGLTGVSAVVREDLDTKHSEGGFAFLHNNDAVSLHGFTGFSGDRDNSIADLLDQFARISGTQADFPGDFTLASQELDNAEEVSLDD